MTRHKLFVLLSVSAVLLSLGAGFVPLRIATSSALGSKCCSGMTFLGSRAITSLLASKSSSVAEGSDAPSNSTVQAAEPPTVASSSAPILNGKRVLPFKVLTGGLKGHKVAAVYAVINSSYKRG